MSATDQNPSQDQNDIAEKAGEAARTRVLSKALIQTLRTQFPSYWAGVEKDLRNWDDGIEDDVRKHSKLTYCLPNLLKLLDQYANDSQPQHVAFTPTFSIGIANRICDLEDAFPLLQWEAIERGIEQFSLEAFLTSNWHNLEVAKHRALPQDHTLTLAQYDLRALEIYLAYIYESRERTLITGAITPAMYGFPALPQGEKGIIVLPFVQDNHLIL